jgi:hypothetical protein
MAKLAMCVSTTIDQDLIASSYVRSGVYVCSAEDYRTSFATRRVSSESTRQAALSVGPIPTCVIS